MHTSTPSPPASPPPAKRPRLDPSASSQPRSRVHYPVARPFAGEWDKMINPLMHYPGRRIPRPAAAPSVHNSVPTPTPHPTPDPEAVSQPEEDVHMDSESDDPLDLISEDSFLADTNVLAGLVDAVNGTEPYQWRDIKGRPDAHLWEQAAMEEFNSLVENGTFQPVRLPPGRKAIGCR